MVEPPSLRFGAPRGVRVLKEHAGAWSVGSVRTWERGGGSGEREWIYDIRFTIYELTGWRERLTSCAEGRFEQRRREVAKGRVMLSAGRGERCRRSVRFPRQPEGRCQPINQKPRRYKTKFVDSQATISRRDRRLTAKRQKKAISSSTRPTNSRSWRNGTPIRGSATSNARAGPTALNVFETPVSAKKLPAHFKNRLIRVFGPQQE